MPVNEKPEPTPQEWVNALLSDKYIPITNVLYEGMDEDRYKMCCLGVLGHLCGFSLESLGENTFLNIGYKFEGSTGPPPSWLTERHQIDFATEQDETGQYPVELIKKEFGLD